MNQVYRIVWNTALGMFQVASELARAHGGKSARSDRRKSGKRRLNAAAALMLAASSPMVLAQFNVNGGTPGADYTVDGSGNVDVTGAVSGASAAVSASGTAGTLTNSGTITGGQSGITASGTIANLQNQSGGAIIGSAWSGVFTTGNGSIGTLSNSGTISGGSLGIGNNGSIANLQNNAGGIIVGTSASMSNGGSIGSLSNSGSISSARYGISNGGVISVLQNQSGGVISNVASQSSQDAALYSFGSIGTLSNSGTISGNGYAINNTGTIAVLQNLSGGVISATSGAATTVAVYNAGSIGTLSNAGTISANHYGIYNAYTGSTIGLLSNSGVINANWYAVYNYNSIGTLSNSGTIYGHTGGVYTAGSIGTLSNTGTIVSDRFGIQVSGPISLLQNANLISGKAYGITNSATISTLENLSGGTISGIGGNSTAPAGIENEGNIGTLSNSGMISGVDRGIFNNGGEISLLQNNTGGTISSTATGISNNSNIGTLSNSGSITGGGQPGINNSGVIVVLQNLSSGVISGHSALRNTATIGVLSNSGTITSAGNYGILNSGTIDVLQNLSSGVISSPGGFTALRNSGGSIGTLSNSGTIAGQFYAIDNTNFGYIDILSNSGTLSGGSAALRNDSSIGSATNTGLISGQIGILNDTFNFIGTLSNSGTISGTSSSGIDNRGTFNVLENLSGGVIRSENLSVATALVNSGTIGTLSNNGTITSAGLSGIYNGGTIGVLQNLHSGIIFGSSGGIFNDGNIGTLSNSGTISSQSYAITNNGTIGTLINAGLISGNIYNASSTDLNLQGGSGTTFGTFTSAHGGSGFFGNEYSNINFSSGNILLNDTVYLPNYALNNTGTGVLQVNNPITITGNYNQGANATLQIGVGSNAVTTGASSDTGYGRLVVSGAATVDSGSSVKLTSTGAAYGFAAGQRFLVIQGGAGSSYGGVTTGASVSSLNYSITSLGAAVVSGNAVVDGGGLDLVLSVDSVGTPATAPNAVAALDGLASYTGLDPALMNLQNAVAFAGTSEASANRVGKKLAPSLNAGRSATAPTLDSLGVVGSRLQAQQTAQAEVGTGLATGDAPLDWTMWGQAFGGHAHQDERSNVDGYSANYGGLLVGADRGYGDAWRVGGAFSYSNTSATNTGDTSGNKTRVNGYGLIGYAGYLGDPWYVNLSAAIVQQQFKTSRQVDITGFSGTANGKFNGMQYVARAEAGYPLRLKDGYVVTPLGNLTYSYQQQNGYTESGGNGAALSVDSTQAHSVKSGLGTRIEKAYSTRYGDLIPSLQAQWVHEYVNTRQATSASFAADPTGQTAFTTTGPSPIANLADVSVGVTLLKANNLSISARYAVQAGSGLLAQTGIIRLQKQF